MAANNNNNPFPWSGVIGGVSTLLSNIGGNRQQIEAEKRQHQYNMQMAQYQNTTNMQNWQTIFDQTNKYNTPIAQMQRLKEGGINPHMAFSNGGGQNTASTSGLPQISPEAAKALPKKPILGGIMEKYMQNKSMQMQMNMAAEKVKQEKVKTLFDTTALKKRLDTLDAKSNFENWKLKQEFDHLASPSKETGLSKYQTSIQHDLEIKSYQRNIAKTQAGLNDATAKNLISNDEMIRLQTQILGAQAAIFDDPAFKKLPATVKAGIYLIFNRAGGN